MANPHLGGNSLHTELHARLLHRPNHDLELLSIHGDQSLGRHASGPTTIMRIGAADLHCCGRVVNYQRLLCHFLAVGYYAKVESEC